MQIKADFIEETIKHIKTYKAYLAYFFGILGMNIEQTKKTKTQL